MLHSFLQKSVNFFHDLLKYILQGGFVILGIVFGYDEPTYNSSPVWELSLLTEFSGITTPAVLSLGEVMQGVLANYGLVYVE